MCSHSYLLRGRVDFDVGHQRLDVGLLLRGRHRDYGHFDWILANGRRVFETKQKHRRSWNDVCVYINMWLCVCVCMCVNTNTEVQLQLADVECSLCDGSASDERTAGTPLPNHDDRRSLSAPLVAVIIVIAYSKRVEVVLAVGVVIVVGRWGGGGGGGVSIGGRRPRRRERTRNYCRCGLLLIINCVVRRLYNCYRIDSRTLRIYFSMYNVCVCETAIVRWRYRTTRSLFHGDKFD